MSKKCEICSSDFFRRFSEGIERFQRRPTCSIKCGGIYRRKNIIASFEEKYIPEPNSGCWLWLAGITHRGYGCFSINQKSYRAPRVSYELHKGKIPAGMIVRHTCDNPPCVNPDHLLLGTTLDNSIDAKTRGRNARGVAHGCAKLSESEVREIRESPVSARKLAKTLGMNRDTIDKIRSRKLWSHLP